MTHVLFFAAFLLLPLFGLWTFPWLRRMDLGGRIAVAFAAGALLVAVVMALLSLLHIEWSRTTIVVWSAAAQLPLFYAAAKLRRGSSAAAVENGDWRHRSPYVIFGLLTCYGLITARESAGDLHFFWGPKAIHFFRAGGIDLAFLADKVNPNSDYPPLVPLLYAWCQTVAHQFSWPAAVLATALFLFGAVAIFRSFSGDNLGAVLLAATLSWGIAIGFAAGAADMPLVFFETLALAALTFIDDERTRDILAAIGLAGAAWAKIEGATFVIAVVLAIILVQRSVKRAAIIAAPAIVLIGAWVVFLIRNGLIFGYGGAKMGIHLSALPKTLALIGKASLYELYGLPWLVPLVLLFLGKPRRALLPLIVSVLTLGATVFFYIHIEDPTWWVAASAPRVLLTPLMALVLAASAARGAAGSQPAEDRPLIKSRAYGVVPQREEAEGGGREAGRHPRGALGQVR